MKKLISLAALLLALMLPAAALSETIVTSFFPVYLFALNLTKGVDGLEVVCLTPPTAGCLHDYQLQTGDMKRLARADVFLINGAGMEAYLSNVREAFPELPVVDASTGIELLDSTVEHDHDHDHQAEDDHDEPEDHDDHSEDDHDEPEDHDVHSEDDHEGHNHEYNAHIWLDARNAAAMAENLADGLIAQFPQHEEAIRANQEAYTRELLALHDELLDARKGLPGHADVITFHEAFPYFAEAYDLHVAAILNREPEDALTPRTLADLCRTVMDLGNPPLLIEPQYDDTAARTVSRETGAPIRILDPIVTGPEDVPLDYYQTVMKKNMDVLLEVLGS